MAEEDNFDIDIYGDEGNENADYQEEDGGEENNYEDQSGQAQTDGSIDTPDDEPQHPTIDVKLDPTDSDLTEVPSPQQGTKRKATSVERTIEAGSTQALMISELHWWTTEDDIRGWVNAARCEDELKDITFSEHKVNGKSKGQAFVDFKSTAAASTVKHMIENLAEEKPARKFAVNYANHMLNPFKTNPKDAPARKEESRRGAYNNGPPHQPSYQSNTFRGRGGGNYNRGGGYNAGSYNNNRNFSGGMNGGYNNGMAAGGFQGVLPNPMMNGFNGGFNRGGGMAMRGGRGGMNTGMGMGMPMGGMAMGMNPMMGGMNMGFQGNQNMFNPAMFNQGQAGWNQQGGPNKRQRQE